jgi:S-DNA-T family DNA segregation ATPase FtsK/SpoIIIE
VRLSLTVVDPRVGDRADVFVDADDAVPVSIVARRLAELFRDAVRQPAGEGATMLRFPGGAGSAAPVADEAMLYVDGRVVDPDVTIRDSPLREGVLVSIDDPSGCLRGEPPGVLELRVTSGPGAGVVHRLGVGDSDVGSDPSCAVQLDDPAGPGRAVRLRVDLDGGCAVAPHDGADVLVDREPLTAARTWEPGSQLTIGPVLLELALPAPADAALVPSDDGAGLDYNRPPRLLPPLRQTKFRLPAPPSEQQRRPIPIVMAVVPLAMALVFVFVLKYPPTFLAFGLMSPVMLISNFVSTRRQGHKSYRQQLAEYRERKARIEGDAQEALLTERTARRTDCPDPASALLVAVGPRSRLWERRRHDPDHLVVRVGTADLPSEVVLEDPTKDEHRRQVTWEAPDVPVAVPLPERGVLGIAGRGDLGRAVARWVVAQSAVLHSPADLEIYVLTDATGRESWEWVRWLPHTRPAEGQDTVALLGTDTDSVGRRVAELVAIVTARTKARKDAGATAVLAVPDILVVLDGARRLRSLPGVIQVLRDGPAVGVYAVCVDADERLLPEECHAVVIETPTGVRVSQMRTDVVEQVRPDLVTATWCERLARALAPIRDVSGGDDDATLPSSSRLLDVLQIEPPTEAAIAARWAVSGMSTQAVVGESLDGPFAIDIRRDGPHGLVAGTTGSGKSELLQTLVASLAVANRPDAMTFVLVDYKGGSAFKDCVLLPHTVGMVTDLDTYLVERALQSLGAELTRREHILAAAGAKDIEDYTDLTRSDTALRPLPRLLIVIDEFASMVRDLPDFVTGLVNIAQRGRSLGIHLVLATQRPSGVVSSDIRANTNLRIALRVTDAAESSDVIDAPDAARINKSTPGRAYVRLGHASLVPFQAGRVGGRRPGTLSAEALAPFVADVEWADLGRPAPVRPQTRGDDDEVTDLKVLVDAIRGASEALQIEPAHSPWLPALPAALLLDDLPAPAPGRGLAPVPYAADDLPAQQARRTAAIDFATFGHLFAAGAPRTGRSQLLRTIAGSIARTHSCADVHLYGIDCGNGALLPLVDLPHCGAVVTRTQTERVVRLIQRLGQEVNRRQEVLAERGDADLTEQRAGAPAEQRLPHIMVLLDRWEGFMTTLGEFDGGKLVDEVMKILREGASVGVHLVIAGDRSLLSGRIATTTEDKIAFRLADRTDFSLIGMNPRKVPDELVPGRGFRAETLVQTQVALLDPDTSGQGQAAALAGIGAEAKARDAGVPRSRRPFRVDVLPSRLSFEHAWQLRDDEAPRPLWGLIGVGGDELSAVGPDLRAGPRSFIVGGPPKSGRSTVLLTMARSFLAGGAQIVVVAPRPSPMRDLAGREGVVSMLMTSELTEAELTGALDLCEGPAVVLVDDAELLKECGAAEVFRRLLRTAPDLDRGLVLAGNADDLSSGFSGWQVDVRKGRRGALLSPQSLTDGDLIGVRVPRSLLGQPVAPGRALIHLGDGELVTVQVPMTSATG